MSPACESLPGLQPKLSQPGNFYILFILPKQAGDTKLLGIGDSAMGVTRGLAPPISSPSLLRKSPGISVLSTCPLPKAIGNRSVPTGSHWVPSNSPIL